MKNKKDEIKAPGYSISITSFSYTFFFYLGLMNGVLLIFPLLFEDIWMSIIPSFFLAIFMVFHAACYFHSVVLRPNEIILKRFGSTIGRIPVSELKSFCAVGCGRDNVLCLSRYSFEEMARMNEAKLLRGVFTKHEMPFRKRKADWQDDFAREYLIRLRRKIFGVFSKQNTIMIEMHPAFHQVIRNLYPHLPYKNFTGITSPHVSRFTETHENYATCFKLQANPYVFRMEPDGIHITEKEKEFFFLPANQLKTAVRADFFTDGIKRPPHSPVILITSMSEEELANQPSAKGYSLFHLNQSGNQPLSAMMAATYLTFCWNKSKKDYCVIPHTAKNLETLRTLYPHVSINEISAEWLSDS